MRLSITARIALLAIGLALVSALALAGTIWQQTHDDAIDVLRRDALEQADALAAVYRSGGQRALAQELEGAGSDDDTLIAEVVDASGRRLIGAGPDRLAARPVPGPFRIAVLGASGDWAEAESGFVIRPAGRQWLVSGRMLDDWQRAQRAIERALLLAVLLAVGLGIAAGLVLARYVSRRLDRIAGAVAAVAAGDLGRRVEAAGGDSFDRLALGINGMLDRIGRLMAELRIVTDSIAHDLRSPIARLRSRAETVLAADDGPQRDAALAGLIAETDQLMRMLGVLLEISRTETASRDSFAPADLALLVGEIAELYAPVAEEAGLAFRVRIDSPLPLPLPLHRQLLSQAIANLIDNALRHAAAGGAIELAVSAGAGDAAHRRRRPRARDRRGRPRRGPAPLRPARPRAQPARRGAGAGAGRGGGAAARRRARAGRQCARAGRDAGVAAGTVDGKMPVTLRGPAQRVGSRPGHGISGVAPMIRLAAGMMGLAIALATAAPARADVVSVTETAFVVGFRLEIAAPPAKVWETITLPGAWWEAAHTYSGDSANMTLDPSAGGCWCEKLPDGGSAEHMRVVNAQPRTLLRLLGGLGPLQAMPLQGVLTYSLKPAGEGTELSISYAAGSAAGGLAELAPLVDQVLAAQWPRLKEAAEAP